MILIKRITNKTNLRPCIDKGLNLCSIYFYILYALMFFGLSVPRAQPGPNTFPTLPPKETMPPKLPTPYLFSRKQSQGA